MKILKNIGVGLAIFILLGLGIGLFLPSEFGMERSTVINAPMDVVYAQVNDLKNWEKWSNWKAKDPQMKITYSDNTVGKGAWYSWEGTTDKTGKGKLVILDTSPSVINTELEFEGQAEKANGFWKFEQTTEGVKATWGFKGSTDNIIGKYFGLMIDSFLSEDFEKGLANLKQVAEAAPPIQQETQTNESENTEGGQTTEQGTEDGEESTSKENGES